MVLFVRKETKEMPKCKGLVLIISMTFYDILMVPFGPKKLNNKATFSQLFFTLTLDFVWIFSDLFKLPISSKLWSSVRSHAAPVTSFFSCVLLSVVKSFSLYPPHVQLVLLALPILVTSIPFSLWVTEWTSLSCLACAAAVVCFLVDFSCIFLSEEREPPPIG